MVKKAAKQKWDHYAKQFIDFANENPVLATGVAFGAGVMGGALIAALVRR